MADKKKLFHKPQQFELTLLFYFELYFTVAYFVLQHFVFVVAGLLGYLIPDVPVSVRKEMQKEKKHAYEVVLIRDEKQVRSISSVATEREKFNCAQ